MQENDLLKSEVNLEESNLKFLRDTQKRSHTKLERKKQKSINELTKEILSVYKNGIRDIFDTPEPKESEVCLIMIFKKNERFLNLYKPIMNIFGSALIKPEFELSNFNSNYFSKNKNVEEQAGASIEEFIFILKETLSEINKSNENLIEVVINNYPVIKKEKNLLLKNDIQKDDTVFFYEDFIFIFCSFIHYFTGLKLKMELSGDKFDDLFLFIYGDEDKYELIAEFFGFELQLKPYALKYEDYTNNQVRAKNFQSILTKETDSNNDINSNDEDKNETPMGNKVKLDLEENLILNNKEYEKNKLTDLQFKELDISDKLGFPPYLPFDLSKKEKFRIYEKNDTYHFCEFDPDFGTKKCTHTVGVLRNIDKLRLIKLSLEDIFHFNDLYEYGYLKSIVYKRDLVDYKDQLPLRSFSYNFFSVFAQSNLMDLINTFRNLYNEYISFYFLWMIHLIHWLLFPSFFGVLLYGLVNSNYIEQKEIYNDSEIKIDLKDIILLSFSGIIIILADVFQKTWKQKEKIFCYFWGMENFTNSEPNDDFKSDESINFLFKTKIKIMKQSRFILRNVVSYAILWIIIIIRVVSIHFLFSLQRRWNKEHQTVGKLGYAVVSGGISLFMTQLYKFLSRKLSYWENHKRMINQHNSLTFKVFMFEFFNNYGTLFYIAFYKPYLDIMHNKENVIEQKNDLSYFSELQMHLYVLLLINFGENIFSLVTPVGYYFYQTKIKNKRNNKEVISKNENSVRYQMTCFQYDNLLIEYMQKIILFGYTNLFFVAAPLAPIIIIFIIIVEYLLDSYKVANYLYIKNIGGATGIEIYNIIIKIISFIGIISNGGLILFTKQYEERKNNSFKYFNFTELSGIVRSPISIFIVFENIILLFMSFISINVKPKWFTHLEKYKAIYKEKYFNRDAKKLPHLTSNSKKLNEKNI